MSTDRALEAARRIVEFDPVHGDAWSDALAGDAVCVARHLLSADKGTKVKLLDWTPVPTNSGDLDYDSAKTPFGIYTVERDHFAARAVYYMTPPGGPQSRHQTELEAFKAAQDHYEKGILSALTASRALIALSEEVGRLREALIDATAHLAAAASAYRKHASRHRSAGRAVPDALFSTRADDFDRAAERARGALTPPDSQTGDSAASHSDSGI